MDEQTIRQQAEQIVNQIREFVKNGSASHVILKRKGETVLSVSLNAGILGAVIGLKAAPFMVLTAALVSFGMDCEVEIEKKDGTIINLNETRFGAKLENLKESAKDKARDLFGDGFEVSVTVDPDEESAEETAAQPCACADGETRAPAENEE